MDRNAGRHQFLIRQNKFVHFSMRYQKNTLRTFSFYESSYKGKKSPMTVKKIQRTTKCQHNKEVHEYWQREKFKTCKHVLNTSQPPDINFSHECLLIASSSEHIIPLVAIYASIAQYVSLPHDIIIQPPSSGLAERTGFLECNYRHSRRITERCTWNC